MSNFSSIFYEGKDCENCNTDDSKDEKDKSVKEGAEGCPNCGSKDCDGSCNKKDKKEVQKESGLFGYDLV